MDEEQTSDAASSTTPQSYSSDAPVRQAGEDKFRRWPFAQRVAQTLANRKDPRSIVIGIYGAWGEGKTSVLNFMQDELSSHPSVICLKFNPWRYPDEEKLLSSFFFGLAAAIGASLKGRKDQAGDLVNRLGPLVGALFDRKDVATELGKLLSDDDIERRRDQVGKLLREAEKRVVVIMDDIDRLEKSEIQAVFRLVKLTADFDNTAFVLAFDNAVVEAALQERYGTNSPEAGAAFLEKIIQVPLQLPAIPKNALRAYCLTAVDAALRESETELTDAHRRAASIVRGCIPLHYRTARRLPGKSVCRPANRP